MSEHKHTDECLAYAAKTGNPFCIAECKDSYEADNAELKRENKPLKEFWNRLCEYIWDMGDFDGGTHQDWGLELGLLRIEIYDPEGKHKDWNVQDVIAGDEFFVNNMVKPPEALLTAEGTE